MFRIWITDYNILYIIVYKLLLIIYYDVDGYGSLTDLAAIIITDQSLESRI